MAELSRKRYWNARYARIGGVRRVFTSRLRALKKRLRHHGPFEYLRSYDDFLLWDAIYKNYMPKRDGARVLEVGSAPGGYLVRVSQAFNFVPYGVEYSETGVRANKEKFRAHNLDPENVIHADFLSEAFQDRYRGCFDVVVSRGFIEHFSNPQDVVDKHLNVLTPGGYLFVSVPNLRGVNYVLSLIFQRRLLPMHNLHIMQKEEFAKLFDAGRVDRLFCDYYGIFNFGLFEADPRSLLRPVLGACQLLQLPLNAGLRFFFGEHGPENRFTSPFLLFVGKRRQPR